MSEETPEEARQRVTSHRQLVQSLEELLYRHDPIGIAFGDNPDEYSPEADSIVPRLRNVETVEDVRRIVHEEFVRWFDADTAGPAADYQAIADELWTLLRGG
jgi:hypothetical protein